jgi:hypothetical protein
MDGTTKRLKIADVVTNMFRSVLALSPGALHLRMTDCVVAPLYMVSHSLLRHRARRPGTGGQPSWWPPLRDTSIASVCRGADCMLEAAYLALGKIAPDWQQLELHVGGATVASAVSEATGVTR